MGSALVVIIAIGLVWAAFLVPPILNSRREAPLASTAEYDRVAARLSRVQTRVQTSMPRIETTKSGVLVRRRRILIGLIGLAVTTLAFAVFRSSLTALMFNLVIDGALAWYVAMLLQIKQTRALPQLRPAAAEAPTTVPVPTDRPAVKVVAS
jgi:hypothetical protein